MNKGRLLFHNGRVIWLSDYSTLAGEEYIRDINDTGQAYLQYCDDTNVDKMPCMLDFTGSKIDAKIVDVLRKNALHINKHCDKLGAIGVSTFLNMFASTITMLSGIQIKAFLTKEEALDWLSS